MGRTVEPERGGSSSVPYGDVRAATLGAATFFLPCGFTQAVQLYALSTGSPRQAATVMACLALGTASGLTGLGGAVTAARAGRGCA